MRNIELKARTCDLAAAESAARAAGAAHAGVLRQVDTYFRVPSGRLKLRECDPDGDYLVHYHRPDIAGARGCDYTIATVPAGVKPLLADALGILAVVDKTRVLYLWHNVRIHLDRVAGLGDFIEFESVLSNTVTEAEGHRQVAFLQERLGIADTEIVAGSYLDLTLSG
jgi:adenylate cyclase class IV